jgi:hydrogenase expression/formation protein HypE
MSSEPETPFGSCPVPVLDHRHIILGHGSGGTLTAQLVEGLFLPAFANPVLERRDDQAVVDMAGARTW